MELMKVSDAFRVEGKGDVLTGPLLLPNVSRKSDVERLIGTEVSVTVNLGTHRSSRIKEVLVRQTMGGETQLSLGIESIPNDEQVLIGSIVHIDL